MFKRLAVFIALSASLVFAQQGSQPVNTVIGPAPYPTVTLYFYSGSSVTAICYANALNPITTFYRSSNTLTNIVVASNVGTITLSSTAQFWVGQQVTVAGSTTAALNGTYRINTVSGSTATITTVAVGDATYNNAAMTLSTTGPMLNANVWSIQLFTYISTNLTTSYFAGTPSVTTPQGIACSNRGNY